MKMNPLCLLTKGRTIRDMGDRSGAYKMLARTYLPKFDPTRRAERNAFATVAVPSQPSLFEETAQPVAVVVETPKIEQSLTPAPTDESSAPAAIAVEAPAPTKAISKSPFAAQLQTEESPTPQGVVIAPNFKGSLWERLMAQGRDLFKRLTLSPKARQVNPATVQTELALEKVIPLRNDLNEDDLEIVLVERKEGTPAKPLASLSKVEMTGEAWTKLTAPFRKKAEQPFAATAAPEAPKAEPELAARV